MNFLTVSVPIDLKMDGNCSCFLNDLPRLWDLHQVEHKVTELFDLRQRDLRQEFGRSVFECLKRKKLGENVNICFNLF